MLHTLNEWKLLSLSKLRYSHFRQAQLQFISDLFHHGHDSIAVIRTPFYFKSKFHIILSKIGTPELLATLLFLKIYQYTNTFIQI